jgi:hypothetical protein
MPSDHSELPEDEPRSVRASSLLAPLRLITKPEPEVDRLEQVALLARNVEERLRAMRRLVDEGWPALECVARSELTLDEARSVVEAATLKMHRTLTLVDDDLDMVSTLLAAEREALAADDAPPSTKR